MVYVGVGFSSTPTALNLKNISKKKFLTNVVIYLLNNIAEKTGDTRTVCISWVVNDVF